MIGATTQRVFEKPASTFDCEWVPITFPERELPQPRLLADPEIVFDYNPAEFNPRGDYFILGRKPKEFREVDCLEIAVDEDKISGRVLISTRVNDEYGGIYAISGLVTDRRISVVAIPGSEDDVGYRFEGEFLRQGEVWRAGKSEAVLKGRLSKIKGDATVAEAEVKFRIEYLGC